MFRRSEKKFKAVFKMQFQATQVPKLKAKYLMISLVPVGVGKPTVRLPKAPIIEGTCTWESPVYETMKLVMETKTGRIREKFYYVIVSTGSSKSGFLGEVSVDFADLAEATKPMMLSLPLQTSKSGAVLHVTLEKIQGGPNSRHGEDNEAAGNEDAEDRDCDSLGRRDMRSNESDDSSQVPSPRDDLIGNLESPNLMKTLERKAEMAELEAQSLRKQIGKETKRGQQLSEQIVSLREERDALQAECEELKSSSAYKNGEIALNYMHEDIKEELQREKQLNKKLKLQLQKSEDSNSEFVLAMRDLSKKLDHKNAEISQLSSRIKDLHTSEALGALPRRNEAQNADEINTLKKKIQDLCSEIEVHKKEQAKKQMEVDRLMEEFEDLETENKHIYSKLEQLEKENAESERNYTESLATVKQLKLQIESLEAEKGRQEHQYSESLNIIDDLEFQVESLQKELEKRSQAFDKDLQAETEARIEQERRATRAEEAFRKARWNNANAAEKLQEEVKQISAEMTLKIEENEKLAHQAMAEADVLRGKNEGLEEQLQKANEELQSVRDQYERILKQHSDQSVRNKNSDEAERRESEMLQRWKLEKEDLEKQLANMRREAEKLTQENVSIKSQLDQKKTKEENLHLHVKKLRLQNNEVKNHLAELEMENDGLKKEMCKLQSRLCKNKQGQEKPVEQNFVTPLAKERIKEASCMQGVSTDSLEQETAALEGGNKTNKNMNGSLQVLSAEKSGQTAVSSDVSSLLSEVSSLKERNKSMEEELKEMRERYSEISLRFAEVEGERQQLVMTVRNLKSGKKS